MILSRLQCRRFFAMFDALTEYANERLDVVDADELHTDDARGMDEAAQAEVSREIWQNLGVIDDFVRDNPAGLTAGELACVASWREGLSGMFLVDVFPDGEVRFMGSGYAFEVVGFSKEIVPMLRELPAAVQTTLLPFDGVIVYAEYMDLQMVDFGDGMLNLFDEEIERISDEGLIVKTADDLLQVAQSVRASELERDTQEMLADLESGRFAYEHDSQMREHAHHHGEDCDCGHDHDHGGDYDDDDYDFDDDYDYDSADYEQHRGALAGLSYEEREQAVREHMIRTDASIAGRLVELLDDECEGIPLTRSLFELLNAENPHDVRRFAGYLGMGDTRELQGDDFIAAVVKKAGDVQAMQVILNELTEHHIASLKRLAEMGGRWDVEEDDVTSLRDLPVHELGFSYVFHEGTTFSFIMPDEVLAISGEFDWEGACAQARRYRELVDVADDLVELRGIVPVADIVAEYQRCYPDGLDSMRSIVAYLLQGAAEGVASYELLETPEHMLYALHYELFWAYEDVMGIEQSEYVSEPVTHGELGDLLEDLLKQQEGKEPRQLESDMLAANNLFEWKMCQGPAQAFVRYLDAHVPAIRDDYYFADKVVEELLSDAMWGMMDRGADRLFTILEQNDFIPEPDQIQDVLDLWSNLGNGLPVWPNNGWAPNELLHAESGGRVFFNEDGSIKKVGRNDPCPCGSGLKYKKCHGR